MRARALRRCAQGSSGASTVRGGSRLVALSVILMAQGAIVAADAQFVKATVTPIDFGPIYAAETFSGIGTVIVTAPVGVNFRVALDGGFHFFAGFRHVKKSDGGEVIAYSLYSDAGCTLALGGAAGAFAEGSSVAGTGIGRDTLITIYGRLTVPASAPPGLYLDSIMVSVNY